jgi:hypothetical protein
MLKLEDIITVRHVELMCKVTLATGSIVGYAYAMEFFIAWYSGNPYERFQFLPNRAADPVHHRAAAAHSSRRRIGGRFGRWSPATWWCRSFSGSRKIAPACWWFSSFRSW